MEFLWIFLKYLDFFARLCMEGDRFPTKLVGIKRKVKRPTFKVERFYLIVLFYCKLRYERLRALCERFGVFRFAARVGVAR